MVNNYSKTDLRNYSVEENFAKLIALIESNPELWDDRYTMATGQQLLRLIAAGESITGVKMLLAHRETFSSSMQRLDSMLGYGETMGYSSFRGSNELIDLTVMPTQDALILKRSKVGTVQGVYDIIAMQDYALTTGVAQTIQVKIGNRLTAEQQIINSNYRYVRFLNLEMSDDVMVYKNNIFVPHGQEFKTLLEEGKCALITNAYSGVDVWFLNTELNPVQTGDTWKLDYIKYLNVSYTLDEISFDYGVVSSGSQVSTAKAPETLEDLRANIPVYRDGERDLLANKDILKYFSSLVTGKKDTNVVALNTVHSLLSYCFEDLHLLKDTELTEYEQQVKPAYYFGYCPSTIEHPVLDFANLEINIILQNMTYQDQLYAKIEEIISAYKRMNKPLDLNEITYALSGITDSVGFRYVKKPTVGFDIAETPEFYSIGTIFQESEVIKRVRAFNYISGTTVETLPDGSLTSGSIFLTPYRAIWGAPTFELETYYKEGTIVKIDDTHYYRVHPNLVLPEEPLFSLTPGSLTVDNQLVWLTIPYSLGDTEYSAGLRVKKGQVYKITNQDFSVQLVSFRKPIDEPEGITCDIITESTPLLTSEWNHYNQIAYTLTVGL